MLDRFTLLKKLNAKGWVHLEAWQWKGSMSNFLIEGSIPFEENQMDSASRSRQMGDM